MLLRRTVHVVTVPPAAMSIRRGQGPVLQYHTYHRHLPPHPQCLEQGNQFKVTHVTITRPQSQRVVQQFKHHYCLKAMPI